MAENIIIPDKTRPTYELKKAENLKKMIEIVYFSPFTPMAVLDEILFSFSKKS